GAFLIPYAIMLFVIGMPMFLIELSAGQFTGRGPMYAFEASPIFQGIGAAMVIMSFMGNGYYNMIIAWSLYYLFASWQRVLPWYDCSNEFNTALCNSTGMVSTTAVPCWNESYNPVAEWLDEMISHRISPSEESIEVYNFCCRLVMQDRSESITDAGYIKWDITLCFLLAWILSFICLIKGIRSAGKVVYFTATFPYVILLILLIKGLLLEGALKGIEFYIIPDWSKLRNAQVWIDAAGQVLFTLSIGFGGLMNFASYNKFRNNIYRDTLIVTIGNCLTSFLCGFIIFAIIGHLAVILGRDVDKVAKAGSGLAFVLYPEVVTYLNPPQLWSTLFFFMLLLLGLDSQFAGIENTLSAVSDIFPKLRQYKPWMALVYCSVAFILGLTMCTRAGAYWLDLLGHYVTGLSLVIIVLFEIIVFSWVYGARKIKADIELMCGFQIGWHWWFCWAFLCPGLIVALLIFVIIDTAPASYGDYVLPGWSQGLGWCMALVSMLAIPICAILRFIGSFGNPSFDGLDTFGVTIKYAHRADLISVYFYVYMQRLYKLTKPSPLWTERKNKETGSTGCDKIPTIQACTNPAFETPEQTTWDTVL
ncbi:hypothetical protein CAPTEDRAFT_132296, partial [Capitella teleta]